MSFTVERVDAAVTIALRQRVLRPHQTTAELARAGDGPEVAHYAALGDGEVIGTASVRIEAPPWAPDAEPAWRLRGMATAEAWRNRGVGAIVLAAIIEHVRSHGGGLLWCNARILAVRFYLRSGFTPRGEEWVEPMIGPHIAMERVVAPSETATSETATSETAL